MFRLVIVSLMLCLATSQATKVQSCKKGVLPLNVDIVGCSGPPCDAVKGTSAIMQVHFVGNKPELTALNAKVRATAFGITVPYALPSEIANVCNNLLNDGTCPIYETEDAVYNFVFPIDDSYPSIGVKVEVSIVDQDNDVVTCFVVPIKVKN